MCDSPVCEPGDLCFDCAEADHIRRHPDLDDPDCRECKYRSIQLNPRTTGARRGNGPPAGSKNSWEKGFALDHRGIPYIDGKGNPISVKKFAEKRSHYENEIRRLRAG